MKAPIPYDPADERAPDLSHYRFVTSTTQGAFAAARPFAVICKCDEDSYVDPTCQFHVQVALTHGLPLVLYDFEHNADPATLVGRVKAARALGIPTIGCADMEAKDLTPTEAIAFVTAYEAALGELPIVYGHSWLIAYAAGLAGTIVARCASWQPEYDSSVLHPVEFMAPPIIWQYAGGNPAYFSPGPRTFPGVHDVHGQQSFCDMNTLLDSAAFLALFHLPQGGFMADLTEAQQLQVLDGAIAAHWLAFGFQQGTGESGKGANERAAKRMGAVLASLEPIVPQLATVLPALEAFLAAQAAEEAPEGPPPVAPSGTVTPVTREKPKS